MQSYFFFIDTMAAIKLLPNLRGDGHELEGEGQLVQPISQSLYVSPMSACINVVFEFEEPITEISRCKKMMADALLPKNPLSCIMVVALTSRIYSSIRFFMSCTVFQGILQSVDIALLSIYIYVCAFVLQKKDVRGALRWQRKSALLGMIVFKPQNRLQLTTSPVLIFRDRITEGSLRQPSIVCAHVNRTDPYTTEVLSPYRLPVLSKKFIGDKAWLLASHGFSSLKWQFFGSISSLFIPLLEETTTMRIAFTHPLSG